MPTKNVDFALIGPNYLSYLLSDSFLLKGKRVIIFDYKNINLGETVTNSLTFMEYKFLQKWLEHFEDEKIKSLDHYVNNRPFFFYIGKKEISLGDSPFRNYRELARKFPKFFLNEKSGFMSFETEELNFNLNYNQFCEKVVDYIFSGDYKNDLATYIEKNLPETLQFHFNYFLNYLDDSSLLSEAQKVELNSLTYLSRAFYQMRLSSGGRKDELAYLFLSLLSPLYYLDHEKLSSNLSSHFHKLGGSFFENNISFDSAIPTFSKGMQFETLDGVVVPQKIFFFSGLPKLYASTHIKKHALYKMIMLKVKFTNGLPDTLKNKRILFTSPLKIGTERPFWEVNFFGYNANFKIAILSREAAKIEFIRQRVLESISEDLKFLYPEFDLSFEVESLDFTHDFFVEDKALTNSSLKFRHKDINSLSILSFNLPFFFSKFKSHFFYGPMNNFCFGKLSLFLELKKWRDL